MAPTNRCICGVEEQNGKVEFRGSVACAHLASENGAFTILQEGYRVLTIANASVL
jgi:hypothetical protein